LKRYKNLFISFKKKMASKDSWDDSSDDEEEMQPVVKYDALQFVLEPVQNLNENCQQEQAEEAKEDYQEIEENIKEPDYDEDADQSDWEEDYDEMDAYDKKLGRYVCL
jgi:hypothetical protein